MITAEFSSVEGDTLLPTPRELQETIPLSLHTTHFIEKARQEVALVLNGTDPRLLLVVGPCSVHDLDATYEYAEKLKRLADEVSDIFCIIMRVYLEKPRTIRGWKGFLFDPHLDGSHDLKTGLILSRQLLANLTQFRLPVGTELLEINTHAYLSDLLSWGCIGARTSTSQPHRQLAASLPFPIGFKNTMDGNIENAIHGIVAGNSPHTFFGLNQSGQLTRKTAKGNPDCHVVLRGGRGGPNYDRNSIRKTEEACLLANIRPSIVIDCSHDNCNKRHEKQIPVFHDVLEQIQEGSSSIRGLMLESHLFAGAQSPRHPLRYGVSITDPCLDFATTRELICEAAQRLQERRLTHYIK